MFIPLYINIKAMRIQLTALILFALFIFTACSSSPEQKARELIKKELNRTLHDIKSCEPVEFGNLDSTFTDVEDAEGYIEAFEKGVELIEKGKAKLSEAERYKELEIYSRMKLAAEKGFSLIQESKEYIEFCDSIESAFIPEFIGWQMQHSFRANNASGNKVISHVSYIFDHDITRIIDSERLSE